MLSRRTLATPRCEGVVPIVTVMNGTDECLAGTMNNTQPVQVMSQLPMVPPERVSETLILNVPYAPPMRPKSPEPPP